MDCPFFESSEHPACQQVTAVENLDKAMDRCTGGGFRQCLYFWLQLTQVREARAQRASVSVRRTPAAS